MKIFMIYLFSILLFGCMTPNNINDVNISTENGSISFLFPHGKNVLVYHYEINDYENFEKDGITFKRLYVSNEINQEMKKITIKDYKSNKIIDNHAYYILIGEQGLNKQGIGFTSVGFCLSNEKILIQGKNENTAIFVKKCHIFKK